jgi:hypothetical protein
MKTTIELAREVKMPYDFVTGEPINIEKLKAFEAIVRADEREACAFLVEENVQECSGPMGFVLQSNADAIRARGEHMKTQSKALQLADELDGTVKTGYWEAAAELRRLHSVNAELLHWMKYIQAQTHLAHIHDTASAAIAKAQEKT